MAEKNLELIKKYTSQLKAVRIKQNMSQEDLGALTGFKAYTIDRIEAGKYNLSADKLFVILNALKIDF